MSFMAADAPPLGNRPSEPKPGRDSLADPRGEAGPWAEAAQPGPTCPDCGLPFGEHPDFHAHGGGHPAQADEGLPGQRLDEDELGGDPAEA